MLSKVLLILLALMFELIGCWWLIEYNDVPGGIFFFIWPHIASASIGAMALHAMLPRTYTKPDFAVLALLFSSCLFMPLFGLLGLLTVLLYTTYARHPDADNWQQVGVPSLPFKPLEPQKGKYGQSGLMGVLRNAPDEQKRLSAIIATRQMADRESIPILKEALHDPVDDIRLLAYSMLDGKEEEINRRIKRLRDRLRETDEVSEMVSLEKQMAEQYWELAYLGLTETEVVNHILAEADKHIMRAIKEAPTAPELHFQRGRILMTSGYPEDAEAHFDKAIQYGMPSNEVLPYMAEAAFEQRAFAKVKAHLQAIDPIKRKTAPLSHITEYWL